MINIKEISYYEYMSNLLKNDNMMIDIKEEDFDMKDSIVEAVRQELLERSEVGIKKYNTTLDREDLELSDWLVHAYQELLDGALYLKRAKKDVEELNEQFDEIVRDFYELKKKYECLSEINDEFSQEVFLKDRIITNLNKVILSQEQEILELKKEKHLQEKRRAWHY